MIRYVQQATNTWYNMVNTSTVTVPINNIPTRFNHLMGAITTNAGNTLSSITDPRGNAWSTVQSFGVTGGVWMYSIWSQTRVSYQAGDSITLNLSTSQSNVGMITGEFSGIYVYSGFDISTGNFNSGAVTSATLAPFSRNTKYPNELLITSVATTGASQTITAPTGYTPLSTGTSNAPFQIAYQMVNTVGTYAATWNYSTAAAHAATTASYYATQPGNMLGLM